MEQDAAARGQRGQCERVAAVEKMMAEQWQNAAKQLCAVLMRGGEPASASAAVRLNKGIIMYSDHNLQERGSNYF